MSRPPVIDPFTLAATWTQKMTEGVTLEQHEDQQLMRYLGWTGSSKRFIPERAECLPKQQFWPLLLQFFAATLSYPDAHVRALQRVPSVLELLSKRDNLADHFVADGHEPLLLIAGMSYGMDRAEVDTYDHQNLHVVRKLMHKWEGLAIDVSYVAELRHQVMAHFFGEAWWQVREPHAAGEPPLFRLLLTERPSFLSAPSGMPDVTLPPEISC